MKSKERLPNRLLRKAREQRGWTQKDVAYRINLPDVRTFRRWESGEAFPSLRYRARLCELFTMSAEELGLVPIIDSKPSSSLLHDEKTDAQLSLPMEAPGKHALPSLPFLPRSSAHKERLMLSPDWNRHQILNKVEAFWIKDVLEKSQHTTHYLQLILREEPGMVENAWEQVMLPENEQPVAFSKDASIVQIYDDAGSELLILGEPGFGQTTLLLEIARELLARAFSNEQHPLPIVFNLSSWTSTQMMFEDWLVQELHSKYQVPPHIGQEWIDDDVVLPLLDGLDEVQYRYRSTCLKALCAFRQMHGLVPMVVCCRRQEYLDMHTRLLLHKAVTIQPLTTYQIDEYLQDGGEDLAELREVVQYDRELQALLAAPLMLTTITTSFKEGMPNEFQDGIDADRLRLYVCTTYVKQALNDRHHVSPYSFSRCLHWLRFTARQMKCHNQTELYLERMQFNWVSSQRLRQLCNGLIAGICAALVGSELLGFIAIPLELPILRTLLLFSLLTLILGSIMGSCGALFEHIWPTPLKKRSIGSLIGVLLGSGVCALGAALHLPAFYLVGAIIGVVTILTFVFLSCQEVTIRPTEKLVWSWNRMRQNFLPLLVKETIIIGGIGIIGILFDTFVENVGSKILMLVIFCSVFLGICFGISLGFGGFTSTTLDEHSFAYPNEGIRRSTVYALRHACITAVSSMVLLVLPGIFVLHIFPDPTIHRSSVLLTILFCSLIAGLLIGMYYGGEASLKHLLLHTVLWLRGDIPWRYAHFLDYVAEHALLHKVGGGYTFSHSLLLDYFADM